MADMSQVEFHKKAFASMTDAQLINQMHQWAPYSEMHIAAKLLLEERQRAASAGKEQVETRRFHWFFWPALIAAIASVMSLALQIWQSLKAHP